MTFQCCDGQVGQGDGRTDEQLVVYAKAHPHDVSVSVEMMRWLKDATTEQQRATNRLTKGITDLTAVLVVLTVVQVAIVIAAHPVTEPGQLMDTQGGIPPCMA